MSQLRVIQTRAPTFHFLDAMSLHVPFDQLCKNPWIWEQHTCHYIWACYIKILLSLCSNKAWVNKEKRRKNWAELICSGSDAKDTAMVFLVLKIQVIPLKFFSSFREKKEVITHQTNCIMSNRHRNAWFSMNLFYFGLYLFPVQLLQLIIYPVWFHPPCPLARDPFPHSHTYSSNHRCLSLPSHILRCQTTSCWLDSKVHIDLPLTGRTSLLNTSDCNIFHLWGH